jgi:glycosyltransferase involved in cell wall biosynthesis
MSLTVFINAGPWLSIPPPGYGGVENMLTHLIKKLRQHHGCRVILGTVGSSEIAVDGQISLFEDGQHRYIAAPYDDHVSLARAHMRRVLDRIHEAKDIDIVHDFLEVVGPSMLAELAHEGPPVLHTLQWNLSSHCEFYRRFDGRGRVYFNGVSAPQIETACENLRRQTLGVVHNGVDVSDFTYQAHKQGYVITLARFAREKGQDVAARVCAELGLSLHMAGPVGGIGSPDLLRKELADKTSPIWDVNDVKYYVQSVLPLELANPGIEWVGNVGGEQKRALLAGARALLMPVRWEEPFGMAVIEALASGTPVVAMRRGAMPVLIEDGYNGFLADDEQQFKERLQQIGEIESENCRSSVEALFSAADMAARYLRLYEHVIERAQVPEQHRRPDANGARRTNADAVASVEPSYTADQLDST